MSIAVLLQAAEFLERRDRESEHGYASTMPISEDYSRKRSKSRKSQGNSLFPSRSTHNELEKNRRAHLRHCLEHLKDIVPVGPDCSRHTTLGLLTKAKYFIKSLEDKHRKQVVHREHLYREQRHLRRQLEFLTQGQYRVSRVERSFSECSASTVSTSASSESDEVDILGYGSSSPSDTDDHSSIQSTSSDGSSFNRMLTLDEDSL